MDTKRKINLVILLYYLSQEKLRFRNRIVFYVKDAGSFTDILVFQQNLNIFISSIAD